MNHERGVHRPDKPHKGGRSVRNQIQDPFDENGSSSAFSPNPPTTGTTGFYDLLGEHSSSPDTSNNAASTADTSSGGSEHAEAADVDSELDSSAFANFAPASGMYEDGSSYPSTLASNPQNSLGLGAAQGDNPVAMAPPTQTSLKRTASDVVRNELVVGRSPFPRRSWEVQPHDGDDEEAPGPPPSGDILMLDNFDVEALWEMPLELANDDLTGLFSNVSAVADTDYHS